MKCGFYARMDAEPVRDLPTVLQVDASLEDSPLGGSLVASGASDAFDPTARLTLQVIARSGFQHLGPDRVDLDPPAANAPRRQHFLLQPTAAGEGELWVLAIQGTNTLTMLPPLKPRVAAARAGGAGALSAQGSALEAEPPPGPTRQLRIVERQREGQPYFEYQLDLEGFPEGILVAESPPLGQGRVAYVGGIYQEIENHWKGPEDDSTRFAKDLRTYGGMLYSQLFPEKLQAQLWEKRNQITSIQVVSTEPFIPWELVYIKKPGQGVSAQSKFLGQMGLVRWLLDCPRAPRQLSVRRGRACYVIPSYGGATGIKPLPQAQAEAQFLVDRFEARAVDPTLASVNKLLEKRGAFDLLHFACHGAGEPGDVLGGRVLLQSGHYDSQQRRFVPDTLTSAYVGENSKLDTHPVVVLNACQVGRQDYQLTGIGGFADAFLKRGAGAFVGTLWSVVDETARTFTETFYQTLLENKTAAEAALAARERARQARDATWLAYVVYADPYARLTVQ